MLPSSTVELDDDAMQKFEKLIDVLEDLDDVQQVHHNVLKCLKMKNNFYHIAFNIC